jgi:lysozyme
MQPRNPNNAKGIDVSHWQGHIDWAQVKAAGISFAMLKSTEGTQYVDDYLSPNYTGAKENGIAVGLYHFCRASNVQEAIAEANFFMSVIDGFGGITAFDILPALDIETINAKSTKDIVAVCHAWLHAVEQRYGYKPMIYSYPSFMDNHLGDSFSEYPLWYANYGDTVGQNRNGWEEWTFLQHTDSGRVQGIQSNVDMNEYKGTVEELINKLNPDDANKIINFLSAAHGLLSSDSDKNEVHRLANALRKVSGQPQQ